MIQVRIVGVTVKPEDLGKDIDGGSQRLARFIKLCHGPSYFS